MVISQTEEQQQEAIHKFWNKNKNTIITIVLFFTLGFGGVKYYKYHKSVVAENASMKASMMFKEMRNKNYIETEVLAKSLMDDFSNTPYADMAALFMSKLSLQNDDFDQAKEYLLWIVDNRSKGPIYHTAVARLARLYRENKEYDKAIALLDKNRDAFISMYSEIKGDILFDQNKILDAKKSYEKSRLEAPKDGATPWLQLKNENLSAAKAILSKSYDKELRKTNETS